MSNAIVWAIEFGTRCAACIMMQTNLANELYNSSQATNARPDGVGNKFIAPLIANGKVYVATLNGVEVFGPLPPADWHPSH